METPDWKSFFKGKRVTQLGLGLLGRGVQDAQFLLRHGAQLTVTDTKTNEQLSESVATLMSSDGSSALTLVLGEHRLSDFEGVDFVLKGAGVPLASPYIAHARARNVPIYMDEALFDVLKPEGVNLIGITGTRGKTTTTLLLHHILTLYEQLQGMHHAVHLGGNVRGVATLPLLEQVARGDTVVAELSSWQLQGFGDVERSPNFSIFTNFYNDHLNYYNDSMEAYFKDKAQIFAYHTADDVLIMSPQARAAMDEYWKEPYKGLRIVVDENAFSDIVAALRIPGDHNVQNAALAIAAARELGVPDEVIVQAIETFNGAPGRLERVPTGAAFEVYNDATSTTPDALRVALETLAPRAAAGKGKLVVICGGAHKALPIEMVPGLLCEHASVVLTIPGSGTERLLPLLTQEGVTYIQTENLRSAVLAARELLIENDILVFSPGFASFGEFINEFDRNDTFVRLAYELLV